MKQTIIKQNARRAAQIPAQPVMRTIGKGNMPSVSIPTQHVTTIASGAEGGVQEAGWNGAPWHDGAD